MRAIVWDLFVMVLRLFTASLCAFLSLRTANGDWRRFWMGKHAA